MTSNEKTRQIFQRMEKKLKSVITKKLTEIAEELEAAAVKHIQAQDLNWEKLSKAYQKKKEKLGQSEMTLVATSTYFRNITSKVGEDGMTAWAGVRRGVKTKEGEDVVDLAYVHEYGSEDGRIPARPLWRPVFTEGKESIHKKMKSLGADLLS